MWSFYWPAIFQASPTLRRALHHVADGCRQMRVLLRLTESDHLRVGVLVEPECRLEVWSGALPLLSSESTAQKGQYKRTSLGYCAIGTLGLESACIR
jgi:hypothetical protein